MKRFFGARNDDSNRPVLEPATNIADIDSKPLVGLQYDDIDDLEEEKYNVTQDIFTPTQQTADNSHQDVEKDKKFMHEDGMIYDMIT